MILGWNGRRWLGFVAVAVALATASAAIAQTPVSSCGADSLYLYTPGSLSMVLATEGRPGLTLSWPDLNRAQATCFAPTDTAGLGFSIAATGGFGDRVDRQLLFTAVDSGSIGGSVDGNLLVTWLSEGSSANGRLTGVLNLANNGGVWTWDAGAGQWSQGNGGLPMTWRAANCTALARAANGTLLGAFSRGSALNSDPAGLYRYEGGTWTRLAAEIFDGSNLVTAVVASPADAGRFAVGTAVNGVYVTIDGGATFTRWTSELDPGATAPSSLRVSAMEWTSSRLVVAVQNFGVFVSDDGGQGFARAAFTVPSSLDDESPTQELPVVNDLAADPANPLRFVAALNSHGCYESTDGGLSWHDLYGDLCVPGAVEGAWIRNGQGVMIVAGSPSTIVLGVKQDGIYRTADGGVTWDAVGAALQPTNLTSLQLFAFANVPGLPGSLAVFEDGHGLLASSDGGATWSLAAAQPVLNRATLLLPGQDAGDLILGTWGGGIYVPGTSLPLRDTYTSATTPSSLRSLNLGLDVAFNAGVVDDGDIFRIKAQTFQGWAVWRSLQSDPDNMTLVGLYDRVNPEDCIVGYCGNESYDLVPRCFAAKRAACFDFSTPDTVRFFDDEIHNGFGYYYAVTSFDYGNTALADPENNAASLLFSPRWLGDAVSPFPGAGNRIFVQVNAPATAPTEGDEIYAFPNPVRRGAGFPGDEGERVAITNLPAGARVRVFTAAGDDVRDLGPEQQTGGQIYWNTDNREGEAVAPGVYLYKVEMPQRPDYWGRIVVIR